MDFLSQKWGFIQEKPQKLDFSITWGSIQEWGSNIADMVVMKSVQIGGLGLILPGTAENAKKSKKEF